MYLRRRDLLLPHGLRRLCKETLRGGLRLPLRRQRLELRDLRALLLRDKDIRVARERRRLADSLVRARHKVIVHPQRRGKRVLADRRVPVVHRDREAERRGDIRRVRAAAVNEADAPVSRDRLADSVRVRPAEREFRRRNRASRCMRGSRPHRAVVR